MGKISTLVLIAIYLSLSPSIGGQASGLLSQRAPLHLVRHGTASSGAGPAALATSAPSVFLVGGLR